MPQVTIKGPDGTVYHLNLPSKIPISQGDRASNTSRGRTSSSSSEQTGAADLGQLRAERDLANQAAIQESEKAAREAIAAAEERIAAGRQSVDLATVAATDVFAGICQAFREATGPLPWVREVHEGRVASVNRQAGTAQVNIPGWPQSPVRVRIGAGTPKVGKNYAVYFPMKIPPDNIRTFNAPEPAADPWLYAPAGKFLYYATNITTDPNDGNGYAYGVSRISWPPVDATAVEHLCVLQGPVEGYELREFIGVDGFGNVWYALRSPGGAPFQWGLVFFAPDDWTRRSALIRTGDVRYFAVDSTPGQCNFAGYVEPVITAATTATVTPLQDVLFAAWLHLQSDGGTTFLGGDPPTFRGIGNLVRASDASITPGTMGAHGYYNPPNDGTSQAAHYHWYRENVPTISPPYTLNGTDITRPLGTIYRGRGTLNGHAATVSNNVVTTVTIDGPLVTLTYGTKPSLGAYRSEYLASPDEGIAAILNSGSMMAAWGTSRIVPLEMVTGPAGRAVYRQSTLRGIHVWTRQDGESNAGTTEVAESFQLSTNPTYGLERFGRPNQPPFARPDDTLEVPGITLGALPGRYAVTLWSIGPASPSGYRAIATVAATEPARNNPLQQDWYRWAGGSWQLMTGKRFGSMFADGRDALDLMAPPASGGYEYSEDGGATWQAVPITLPLHPATGVGKRLRNGVIVEA